MKNENTEHSKDEVVAVEPKAVASEPGSQWFKKRAKQDEKSEGWHCRSCGCRDGVSAALANVDKDLRFNIDRPNHDKYSPHEFCPECYWEKITGTGPPKYWEVSGRRREGHGIENVRPGHYGPHDDTSPGYDDATRKREGD